MARYFKNKKERYIAFYNCILELWNRVQAGKQITPSVTIDKYHLGHIKIEPYLRLAYKKTRPTFEECKAVRDELSEHQRNQNKESREKRKNGVVKQQSLFDVKILLETLPDAEIIAASFLKSRNWKLQQPKIAYVEQVTYEEFV